MSAEPETYYECYGLDGHYFEVVDVSDGWGQANDQDYVLKLVNESPTKRVALEFTLLEARNISDALNRLIDNVTST